MIQCAATEIWTKTWFSARTISICVFCKK